MARALMTAVIGLLIAAVPASATVLVLDDGTRRPEPFQTWLEQAAVQTPRGEIRLSLRREGCGGLAHGRVCAEPERALIVLYDWPYVGARYDLYHELGHIVWFRRPWLRAAFKRIYRGGWEEQFAMGYAWCAVNPLWRGLRSAYPGYDYHPTLGQHRSLCRALKRPSGTGSGAGSGR